MEFTPESRAQFVINWDYYMTLGTIIFVVATLVIFFIHEVRVLMIKDLKEKYEYVTALQRIVAKVDFFIDWNRFDSFKYKKLLDKKTYIKA